MRLIAVLLAFLATSARADEARVQDFVSANVLAIFYHELGHAAIDVLDLPVLGQEEDAADVLSVLLIDALYEPDVAEAIAYDAAVGFLSEAEQSDEPAFWDVHGPELQRYYTLVCLFYGADPDGREDFAEELELPEDRAETCPDEFDLAAASWGAVLDELAAGAGQPLAFGRMTPDPVSVVIGEEVQALNDEFKWPVRVTVHVEPCDEVNAFYDPEKREITVCTELGPFYTDMAAELR